MTETTTAALADPITTEIIRNAFVSCAQDMNATLIRSSYTPIIYEGKDCSVAILDEHGDVLGQSLGLPLFLGNLEICVKLAAELHGWDSFRPGDVLYMNDSYMTGTHLNDATIFGPIFWGDRLVPGNVVPGPAIIQVPDTTIVVHPFETARFDPYGNILIDLGGK